MVYCCLIRDKPQCHCFDTGDLILLNLLWKCVDQGTLGVLALFESVFHSSIFKWQTMFLPFTQMMDYVLTILLKWWTMSLHQFTQMIDYVLIILLKWQTKSLPIIFYSDDSVLTILLKWQCPYHFTQMTDLLKWQCPYNFTQMTMSLSFFSNDRLCPYQYHFTQMTDCALTIVLKWWTMSLPFLTPFVDWHT